ncbi:MAG: BlaI/MecI/CopY family transcriptional regulator [Patescibacteria group bacterium]|jgi:predicted transcriptional regulator
MKKVLLGSLESAIMEVIWARGAVSVRDVLGALKMKKKVAYTTAMTVMNRLVDKRILVRKPDKNAFEYRAAKSKEAFHADASKHVIDTLIAECGDVAIVQFMDRIGKVDPELKARLKKLIDS